MNTAPICREIGVYLYDAALAGRFAEVPLEWITKESLLFRYDGNETVAQNLVIQGHWEQLLPECRTPDVVFHGQGTPEGSVFDLLVYESLLHTLPPELYCQFYKKIRWEFLPQDMADEDLSDEDREWRHELFKCYIQGMEERRWEKKRVWD
jgi:hypothetical protein